MRLCDEHSEAEAAHALRDLMQQRLEQDQDHYEGARAKKARELRSSARWRRTWGDEQADPNSRKLWHGLADEAFQEAHDPLPDERKMLQQRERDLSTWWNGPAVLIRPSRTQPVMRYHVGIECGQVTKSNAETEQFEWILEGEAKARDLSPCPFEPCRTCLLR